jgi:hypothetical protein
MIKMEDLDIIGEDAIGASGVFGTKLDYMKFQMEYLIPTFHHQPLTARKIVNPTPVAFDGKYEIQIPTYRDITAPGYGPAPKHKDSDIAGDYVTVSLPQLYMTALFSSDELKQPFAGRDRLRRWVWQATKKMAQWEDIIAFRGDTSNGVVGFIGANSTDLGAPAGVWDVQTNSNGFLDKAHKDCVEIIQHFVTNGLQNRPIKIVMTNHAYMILATTYIAYTSKSNLDVWYDSLPKGSMILASDNIQASPTAQSGSIVAFVELKGEDEGGYQLFASNIQQGLHHTDIWEWRYGLREKFSVKVVDDAYVCYKDVVDTVT